MIQAANYYTTQGMGCVDRLNQNLKTNDWKHKNYSWRACHFQTLFRMILVNSWIVYKILGTVRTFPQFLSQLQQQFKEQYEIGINEEKRKKRERKNLQKINSYFYHKKIQIQNSNI